VKIIQTDAAPKAIGPYSQAVKANGFVFVSGQIPLDPETGQLVDGDIKNQTRRVFENIKAILAAAGCDLSNVVKVTVFTDDISNFSAINEVYSEYFSTHKPARSFVEVSALPRNAHVEIEVIAAKGAKA